MAYAGWTPGRTCCQNDPKSLPAIGCWGFNMLKNYGCWSNSGPLWLEFKALSDPRKAMWYHFMPNLEYPAALRKLGSICQLWDMLHNHMGKQIDMHGYASTSPAPGSEKKNQAPMSSSWAVQFSHGIDGSGHKVSRGFVTINHLLRVNPS